MSLVLIGSLIALNLILGILYTRLKLLLFIVKLVLEGQEMLIERDSVPEKRLITTGLVLLIHLLVLEQLDLRLHCGDLLVQVEDNVFVDDIFLSISMAPRLQQLSLFGGLCQVRVTLELAVNDRASGACIHIVVSCSKLNVAS